MTDRTEIKICGLSERLSLAAALEAGADKVGFIFFEKSPRNVTVQQAADLARFAENKARTVAVTVNASDGLLERIVGEMNPSMLQLHGRETPERVAAVKARFGLPVMKAFAISSAADLQATTPWHGIANRFLFDARPPAGSMLPGGNGVTFDWKLLRNFQVPGGYMLSGGLDASNVGEALSISGACAVDISSGVESAPGVKSIEKIRAFVKTVRDYDHGRLETAN